MRKLFGTDGIRAVAGVAPLDSPTIFAIGMALASTLKHQQLPPRVLLGADTRESSPWISGVIAAGLRSGASPPNGLLPNGFFAGPSFFHAPGFSALPRNAGFS